MIGVLSQASTGITQVGKVPSHVHKEHPSITLCRSALSGQKGPFRSTKYPLRPTWGPFTSKEDPLLRLKLSCEIWGGSPFAALSINFSRPFWGGLRQLYVFKTSWGGLRPSQVCPLRLGVPPSLYGGAPVCSPPLVCALGVRRPRVREARSGDLWSAVLGHEIAFLFVLFYFCIFVHFQSKVAENRGETRICW